MNANVIMNTIATRLAPHLADAAKKVIHEIDYEPFAEYLRSKPQTLLTALEFQSKVEAISLLTKTPVDVSVAGLFKFRLDKIVEVFIVDVIAPKGEAHVMQFVKMMEVDDTFASFRLSMLMHARAIAKHAKR